MSPRSYAGLSDIISNGATYAAKTAYETSVGRCPEKQNSAANPACQKPNQLNSLLAASEQGENVYLAALAKERHENLACSVSQLKDLSSLKQYQENFSNDVADKLLAIINLRKEISNLKNQTAYLAQLGEDKKPDSKYVALNQELTKMTVAEETILSSIPFIQTSAIQTFIRHQLESFNQGKGATPPHEEILKSVQSKSNSALSEAYQSLNKESEMLKKAADNMGKGLDRATKESLAQDTELQNQYAQKFPKLVEESAATLCRVNAKYGEGAKKRDDYAFAASVGLTVASLGTTAASTLAVSATLRGVAGAARAGKIAESTSRVLRASALGTDLAVGAAAIDKDCLQFQSQYSSQSKTKCEEYSLEQNDANNCVVNALLTTLGVGANIKSIVQKPFKKGAAETVLNRRLNVDEAKAIDDAHNVGVGQLGKDKINPASLGNYTKEQITEKALILRKAGFSSKEIRELMEKRIVGHELKEQDFNALMAQEQKNNEALKKIEGTIRETKGLNQTDRQNLIEEAQQYFNDSNARLYSLMDSPTDKTIADEIAKMQSDINNQRQKIADKIKVRSSHQVDQTASTSIKNFQDMEKNAQLLTAEKTYILSTDPKSQLKSVELSKEVVNYLKNEASAIQSKKLMKAIEKGFVSNDGADGIKRLTIAKVVEVKSLGPAATSRLIGCYENGTLRILKVLFKHGDGFFNATEYNYLCK